MGYYNEPKLLGGTRKPTKTSGTAGLYGQSGAYSPADPKTEKKPTYASVGGIVVNSTVAAQGNSWNYGQTGNKTGGTGGAGVTVTVGGGSKPYAEAMNEIREYKNAHPPVEKADTSTPVPTEPQQEQAENKVEFEQTTTAPQTPMTYGEYLKVLEDRKQMAIDSAETERQRAVADSNAAYEQNKATYGTKAEKLASMGLTGSGYSDYIDSQAYVQHRAEVQNANALAQKAKADAEQKFTDAQINLSENFNDKYNTAFDSLMSEAANGTMTDEEIDRLATMHGITAEDIELIKSKNNEAINKQNAANSAEISSALGDNIGSINAAVEAGTITKEQGDSYIKDIQHTNYKDYLVAIADGDADIKDISKAKEKGEISDEQFETLQSEYGKTIVVGKEQFITTDESGKELFESKHSADQRMNEMKQLLDEGWITPDTFNKFKQTYDKYYAIAYIGAGINEGEVDTGELETVGDNFDVHYAGKTYGVESGGEVTDSAHLLDLVEDLLLRDGGFNENRVFMYQGDLYIHRKGKIYAVQAEETDSEDDGDGDMYWDLLKLFKNSSNHR